MPAAPRRRPVLTGPFKFKLNLSGLSVVENNSKVPISQLAHFSPAWQIYAGAEVLKLDLSSNATDDDGISLSESHGPNRLRLGVCRTAAPRRAGHPAPACRPDVTVVTVTAVDGRPGERASAPNFNKRPASDRSPLASRLGASAWAGKQPPAQSGSESASWCE